MLLAVEMLPSGLGRAVFEKDAAIFTVKFLAHNYNRLSFQIKEWLKLYSEDDPNNQI